MADYRERAIREGRRTFDECCKDRRVDRESAHIYLSEEWIERRASELELLAMLRRLDESSMLLPATLSADLEDMIDRYKDVKTEET